uniref:T9SS type A sorting domain-containing protein n=1 Tax=Roseihalotalea indica TaxID=2867963 RepID=A0AA49GMM4_9BACT|nr:T9SS type A sorting domain-containing protein [Tunicatimonas sp. TK19036]
MKFYALLLTGLIFIASSNVYAQSTVADGNWTSSATWSGGNPPNGWTTINVSHDVAYTSGNYSVQGTLNINNGGYLTYSNNVTITGGSTINVYNGGTLDISGDLILNSNLRIFPGGRVIVDGSVHIYNSEYLHVGDNTGGTTYADMIIKTNLEYHGGRANVNSNGRLAVYGNVSGNSNGGTVFRVRDGGQVYIDGDMTFVGGGDNIINENDTEPYGLYVNGNVTNSGGGATTTANKGDQQDMIDTNPAFTEWVASLPDSPLNGTLPIELLSFSANASTNSVALLWTTAMEENFDFFTVERAGADLQFKALGTLEGQGFSNAPVDYQFSDKVPLQGVNYYRLKATDLDGTVEYHKVVSVWFTGTVSTQIYPNPVIDRQLTVNSTAAHLQIVNSMGQTVLTQPITENRKQVSIPQHVQSGVHIAVLTFLDGTQEKHTLIVQ